MTHLQASEFRILARLISSDRDRRITLGRWALQTVLDLRPGGQVGELLNEEEGEIHGGAGSP